MLLWPLFISFHYFDVNQKTLKELFFLHLVSLNQRTIFDAIMKIIGRYYRALLPFDEEI